MDTPKRIGAFFSRCPKASYSSNTLIVSGQDLKNQVYYVSSGLVVEYSISQSGNLFILHAFGPGAYFPLTALCGYSSETSYFEAFSPTTVAVASRNKFVEFLTSHTLELLAVSQQLSTNLINLTRRLNLAAGGTAYQRLASTLLYLADKLGSPAGDNGAVKIRYPFTHKEIAAWVGTARETASIHLKRLQRKGLITYHQRRFFIPNPARLQAEVDLD